MSGEHMEEQSSTSSRSDPAWNHCILIDMQQRKVQCLYCNKIMSGGVTRLKQHIAGIKGNVAACTNAPKEVRAEFLTYVNTSAEKTIRGELTQSAATGVHIYGSGQERSVHERRRHSTAARDDNDDREMRRAMEASRKSYSEEGFHRRSGHQVGQGSGSRQRSTVDVDIHDPTPLDPYITRKKEKQSKISSTFKNLKLKEKIGRATSRWFFHHGISADTAQGPYYDTMIATIADVGKGVPGPTPYEIYNTYLPTEVTDIKNYIKSFERIWDERGCTLMVDGWTGITRRSMINFLVYCQAGTIFWKSVDASGKLKKPEYLFSLMDGIIDEIGEHRIVQVVTDNAAPYKAAGQLLMEKRKYLYWLPCSAHSLDLILEDICQDDMVNNVVKLAQFITAYIYNHNCVLSLMREHTGGRELLCHGATRFASHYISLESLLSQRPHLLQMISSRRWAEWMRSTIGAVNKQGKKVEQIIESGEFWENVKKALDVVQPIVKVLRIVDGDQKADMGYLYEGICRAKEEVASNCKENFWKWWEIIDRRWDTTLHRDLHAAGYFFNPRFMYNPSFKITHDLEEGTNNVIKRMLGDDDKSIIACSKLHHYRLGTMHFATGKAQRAVKLLSPADWWISYGGEPGYEGLAYVAIRVLSQTSSASGCERNWSTFSLIHKKLRNRRTSKRLEELVFCHYNMRLKLKNQERVLQGQKEEMQWRDELMGKTRSQDARVDHLINLDAIFDEENALHAWVDTRTALGESEFDPNDRRWAEGELDGVPLPAEFEPPPTKKQKNKKEKDKGRLTGVDIADLTTEEEADEKTSEPSVASSRTSTDSDPGVGMSIKWGTPMLGSELKFTEEQPQEQQQDQAGKGMHYEAKASEGTSQAKGKGKQRASTSKAGRVTRPWSEQDDQPTVDEYQSSQGSIGVHMPFDLAPPYTQNRQPEEYDDYTEVHSWTSVPPQYPGGDISSDAPSMGSMYSTPSYEAQRYSSWFPSRVIYVNSDEYNQYVVDYQMYYAGQMDWAEYVNRVQYEQNVLFQ